MWGFRWKFRVENKHRKTTETENDSPSKDFKKYNGNENEKYVDDNLSILTKDTKVNNLQLDEVGMDFDGNILYPSAMWDENLVYLKIETRFAFKPYINDVYVESFNDETFSQQYDESDILKIKNYNPPNLEFQQLPVKEKVQKNIKVIRMKNGYVIDILTSVDTKGFVKIGGTEIEIYERRTYRENFGKSPLTKAIEKLFPVKQKHKDEGKILMQGLVKFSINVSYDIQVTKDFIELFKSDSGHWMQIEYDDNVLEYWKLPNRMFMIKNKKEGLGGDNNVKNTLPSHLGVFILSNSKNIMNNFSREINDIYNNSIN